MIKCYLFAFASGTIPARFLLATAVGVAAMVRTIEHEELLTRNAAAPNQSGHEQAAKNRTVNSPEQFAFSIALDLPSRHASSSGSPCIAVVRSLRFPSGCSDRAIERADNVGYQAAPHQRPKAFFIEWTPPDAATARLERSKQIDPSRPQSSPQAIALRT